MVGHGGRGGKSSTLTHEQLQTLGCVGKDMPVVQIAPPPIYPPLITKPIKIEMTPELEFQILCKENLLTRMRDSPNHLCAREPKRISLAGNATKFTMGNTNLPLDKSAVKAKPKLWRYAPKEMHAVLNRKRVKTNASKVAVKKAKTLDTRLKLLEEKEKSESDAEGANKNNSDSEVENEELADDDEMDDENDYGGNYFDNGEAFNEEDDNLDDGPVY